MKKTTKGALAAGTAAVLLLGGAGSLAYWSSNASVNGGTFQSGLLTIAPTNVAPNTAPCDANWKYANGAKAGDTVVNIVPGDQITKNCTFLVNAKGDHLTASPTVPTTVAYTINSTPAPTTLSLPVAATYSLAGSAFTSTSVITEADNNKVLTAAINVTFPFGSPTVNGNDTQNLNATLSALAVTLTQTQNTPVANPNN